MRSLPSFTNGATEYVERLVASTSPAAMARSSSCGPLYGTWLNFTPVFTWNHSRYRCIVEPAPAEPHVTCPGRARAYSINSFTDFTGSEALTTIDCSRSPRWITGANPNGSYGKCA